MPQDLSVRGACLKTFRSNQDLSVEGRAPRPFGARCVDDDDNGNDDDDDDVDVAADDDGDDDDDDDDTDDDAGGIRRCIGWRVKCTLTVPGLVSRNPQQTPKMQLKRTLPRIRIQNLHCHSKVELRQKRVLRRCSAQRAQLTKIAPETT